MGNVLRHFLSIKYQFLLRKCVLYHLLMHITSYSLDYLYVCKLIFLACQRNPYFMLTYFIILILFHDPVGRVIWQRRESPSIFLCFQFIFFEIVHLVVCMSNWLWCGLLMILLAGMVHQLRPLFMTGDNCYLSFSCLIFW